MTKHTAKYGTIHRPVPLGVDSSTCIVFHKLAVSYCGLKLYTAFCFGKALSTLRDAAFYQCPPLSSVQCSILSGVILPLSVWWSSNTCIYCAGVGRGVRGGGEWRGQEWKEAGGKKQNGTRLLSLTGARAFSRWSQEVYSSKRMIPCLYSVRILTRSLLWIVIRIQARQKVVGAAWWFLFWQFRIYVTDCGGVERKGRSSFHWKLFRRQIIPFSISLHLLPSPATQTQTHARTRFQLMTLRSYSYSFAIACLLCNKRARTQCSFLLSGVILPLSVWSSSNTCISTAAQTTSPSPLSTVRSPQF